MKVSSIREQYREAQERYPGSVILMRIGGTYDVYWHNAEVVAEVLGWPLSVEGGEYKVSVRHEDIERTLRALLRAGRRVAVAEIVR